RAALRETSPPTRARPASISGMAQRKSWRRASSGNSSCGAYHDLSSGAGLSGAATAPATSNNVRGLMLMNPPGPPLPRRRTLLQIVLVVGSQRHHLGELVRRVGEGEEDRDGDLLAFGDDGQAGGEAAVDDLFA